jgi:hypothetical protein
VTKKLLMIAAAEEYVPAIAHITPKEMMDAQVKRWTVVTLSPTILKKQAHGKMTDTAMLMNAPMNAITRPKNGTIVATTTVEATRAVLMAKEAVRPLNESGSAGRSSSKQRATGVIVKANVRLVKER